MNRILVYYDECNANSDGNLKLDFFLDKNGEYTVYIGSDKMETPVKFDFSYVNRAKFELAAQELLSDAENAFNNKKEDLGMFGGLFENADTKAMAGIFELSKGELTAQEYDKLSVIIDKAVLITKLNNNELTDLKDNEKYMRLGNMEAGFFNKYISKELTAFLTGKNITSTIDYDKLLKEGLVCVNVNKNNGSATIKNVLLAYYGEIGIDSGIITDELCSYLADNGNISGYNDLKTKIGDYQKLSNDNYGNGTGGGNRGTGGGASSGGIGAYYAPVLPSGNETKEEIKQLDVFDDLEKVSWAKEAITNLYYKNIINGKEEGKFYPLDNVKREEFAKILTVAMNMNLVDMDFIFEDIDENDWCFPYVKTSYLAGITTGISENVFGKGLDITRQDLCVMVFRAIKAGDYTIPDTRDITFVDEADISDYAVNAVKILANAGIVSGDENRRFNPVGKATRAEAAQIIFKMLEIK